MGAGRMRYLDASNSFEDEPASRADFTQASELMNRFKLLPIAVTLTLYSSSQFSDAKEQASGAAPACENAPSAVGSEIDALRRANCAFMTISELCAKQGDHRTEIMRRETTWEVTKFPPGSCRAWKAVIESSTGAILSVEEPHPSASSSTESNRPHGPV
jgi:hypothetical protein